MSHHARNLWFPLPLLPPLPLPLPLLVPTPTPPRRHEDVVEAGESRLKEDCRCVRACVVAGGGSTMRSRLNSWRIGHAEHTWPRWPQPSHVSFAHRLCSGR